MNPIDDYRRASATMLGLLGALTDPDLDKPTPCGDWTVRDLAAHVIDNTAFFTGATGTAGGGAPASSPAELAVSGLAPAFERAAGDLLSAYRSPGVLDRDLDTPFGAVPGAVVLSVAFADLLTHCWDLGRACSFTVDVDDELAVHALATWTAFIQDDYRANGMFGEAQPVPPSAPAFDRVAAFAGRAVVAGAARPEQRP